MSVVKGPHAAPAFDGQKVTSLQVALALSFIFCVATVGMVAWKEFGPPSWNPRIEAASMAFDFGERKLGEIVHHEFTLSNTGGEELVITKTTATCGCVTPLLKEAKIPPGYAIKLPVTITLERAEDKVQKQVLVQSNDPTKSMLVLSIVGRVIDN